MSIHVFLKATVQVLLLFAATSTIASAQNLISNPNFEFGVGFGATPGQIITDWTKTGSVVRVKTGAIQGTFSAVFNGLNSPPNGTLFQPFSTTSGTAYVLGFRVRAGGTVTNQKLRVQVLDPNSGAILERTVIVNSNAAQGHVFEFVARSSTSVLRFLDVGSNNTVNSDIFLDQVRLALKAGNEVTDSSQTVLARAQRVVRDGLSTIQAPLNRRTAGITKVYRPGSRFRLDTSAGLMFESAGISAGDTDGLPYGLWASANYTASSDDFLTVAFDADGYSALIGGDISPAEGLYVGLALGYEISDTDTLFNAGSVDTDGWTIAPYLALKISEHFSLDFSTAYSHLNSDQVRIDGSGNRISGEADLARWLHSGNVSYSREVGNWLLLGQVGLLWARNVTDRFVESDGTQVTKSIFRLGQARASGEVAYSWGTWEAFLRGSFERDYSATRFDFGTLDAPESDHSGGTIGAGMRFYRDSGLSGSVQWEQAIGRNVEQDTFSILIRGDF